MPAHGRSLALEALCAGEEVSQNVGEEVSQYVGEEVSQYAGEEVSQYVGEEVSQYVGGAATSRCGARVCVFWCHACAVPPPPRSARTHASSSTVNMAARSDGTAGCNIIARTPTCCCWLVGVRLRWLVGVRLRADRGL